MKQTDRNCNHIFRAFRELYIKLCCICFSWKPTFYDMYILLIFWKIWIINNLLFTWEFWITRKNTVIYKGFSFSFTEPPKFYYSRSKLEPCPWPAVFKNYKILIFLIQFFLIGPAKNWPLVLFIFIPKFDTLFVGDCELEYVRLQEQEEIYIKMSMYFYSKNENVNK